MLEIRGDVRRDNECRALRYLLRSSLEGRVRCAVMMEHVSGGAVTRVAIAMQDLLRDRNELRFDRVCDLIDKVLKENAIIDFRHGTRPGSEGGLGNPYPT